MLLGMPFWWPFMSVEVLFCFYALFHCNSLLWDFTLIFPYCLFFSEIGFLERFEGGSFWKGIYNFTENLFLFYSVVLKCLKVSLLLEIFWSSIFICNFSVLCLYSVQCVPCPKFVLSMGRFFGRKLFSASQIQSHCVCVVEGRRFSHSWHQAIFKTPAGI